MPLNYDEVNDKLFDCKAELKYLVEKGQKLHEEKKKAYAAVINAVKDYYYAGVSEGGILEKNDTLEFWHQQEKNVKLMERFTNCLLDYAHAVEVDAQNTTESNILRREIHRLENTLDSLDEI